MKKPSHDVLLFSLVMFMGVLVLACATKSYINVNYQIPLSSYDLKGEKIFLEIKDMRPDKTIFSEKAKNKFKNFTGLFLFSLSQGEKKNYVVGAFDLPSLFKAAFSRRLENLGIVMLKEAETTEPVIEIDLQKFFLDLVDRKWVAQISYEARLIKDNKLLARETISGDAERYKLISQGDVEKVLGEIFTSLVNKLDFQKLLQQAEL
ncbi:MAG: hypothetical protein JRF31_06610 [Deltaproteobacteria bacterium]|nr:hypothetical protein [Deltaproteobacteria bacterium]MBW1957862.1 hypothetical protein [Deltaproteobacteria bacterium]MBW2012917.1 hypothetical protein [Deltaproteobacteria bacterium]MBW2087670.1 hypothetical protein [Deltaproteobacteria bacterium]MBW2320508.1 hypothetical protein [Deltaproteobacteria bacterium]